MNKNGTKDEKVRRDETHVLGVLPTPSILNDVLSLQSVDLEPVVVSIGVLQTSRVRISVNTTIETV